MNQAMATSTPTEAVHDLLRQIADENNLDVRDQLNELPGAYQPVRETTQAQRDEAALKSRFDALRHAT